MNSHRLALAVIATLSVSSTVSAAEGVYPKQLAGPPSEFATMAPADPTAAAVHSKSALLPLDFAASKAGGFGASVTLPVEGEKFRFLLFSTDTQAAGWKLNLRDSRGGTAKARGETVDLSSVPFGLGNAVLSARYFGVEAGSAGKWSLNVSSAAKAKPTGYVLLEGDSATQLYAAQAKSAQQPGQPVSFMASLYTDEADSDAKVGRGAGRVASAEMRVTDPESGAQARYPMFDDGAHGDAAAGDGIFGGSFVPASSGNWLVQVVVSGDNSAGAAIVRTSEHVVPVMASDIAFKATPVETGIDDNDRLVFSLPVERQSKAERHYRSYAEVWGKDATGADVAVAWIGGMVSPDAGKLNLSLDPRWISLAKAQGPFELRNVRLDDPDVYVTLAKSDRVGVAVPSMKAMQMSAKDIAVDEAMTMGPRPDASKIAKGTGSRLLLVHGYCSGGVWPTSNFTNASTFLDANQSRSNDAFARLILSFGSTWNSYGIVAHSQGGMAATHLYNYYWSGLDNATGSRLIQSVGTPYKGTNLAGILATLGSWFGVGCGSQNDLTYSGAAAWGNGITTTTRAKVNYYTTSFKLTNWWTNDYCNFATDLVLSDPEDGTTEQVNGQFSSAVNRGHTTGQCHTSGMRDPAQYQDASRNAVMNSNAAR